jgi:hypothetical protein
MRYDSSPALRHTAGVLSASVAAAKTTCAALATTNGLPTGNQFRYKAVWFSAAGSVDVVDSYGTLLTITGAAGGFYPCQSYGAVTGGGTTLTAAQFSFLYD